MTYYRRIRVLEDDVCEALLKNDGSCIAMSPDGYATWWLAPYKFEILSEAPMEQVGRLKMTYAIGMAIGCLEGLQDRLYRDPSGRAQTDNPNIQRVIDTLKSAVGDEPNLALPKKKLRMLEQEIPF